MKTILRVMRENEELKDEVKRLRIELKEAKRQVGGFHGDILMYSVVESLLHEAGSLSTLIFEQDRCSGPRNLGSVIKKILKKLPAASSMAGVQVRRPVMCMNNQTTLT